MSSKYGSNLPVTGLGERLSGSGIAGTGLGGLGIGSNNNLISHRNRLAPSNNFVNLDNKYKE